MLRSCDNRTGLAAVLLLSLLAGFSIGGLIPIVSLNLESRGVEPWLIGINTAMPPLGVLIVAPFLPKLLQQFGTINTLSLSILIISFTLVLLPVFPTINAWLFLRFIFGIGLGTIWIVTETWLNTVANKKNRGKIMGFYSTVLASGFAIGPLVPAFIGYRGIIPFLICAAVIMLGFFPLMMSKNIAPNLSKNDGSKIQLGFIFQVPIAAAAAFIAGLLDSSTFTFLPIWGLHHNMPEHSAIGMLTILLTGNLMLQIPIGIMADRFNKYNLIVICGILSICAPTLVLYFLNQPFFQGVILFIWGGAFWGIYTVGLVLIGTHFKSGELTAANTSFVIIVVVSSLISPPLAGASLDFLDPNGFIWFCSLSTISFLIFVLWQIAQQKIKKFF